MTVQLIPLQTANLGSGHWMQSTAEFDDTSLYVSFTEHMTCTNKGEGFTGGVQLNYYDGDGNYLDCSAVQQNGIGQAPIIGAGHRTIVWPPPPTRVQVPAGTAAMLLCQFHDPHNRAGMLGQFGEWLQGICSDIRDFVAGRLDQFANWSKQHPEIAGLVAIAGVCGAQSFVVANM